MAGSSLWSPHASSRPSEIRKVAPLQGHSPNDAYPPPPTSTPRSSAQPDARARRSTRLRTRLRALLTRLPTHVVRFRQCNTSGWLPLLPGSRDPVRTRVACALHRARVAGASPSWGRYRSTELGIFRGLPATLDQNYDPAPTPPAFWISPNPQKIQLAH
jgi:hypothetical protein